MPTTFSIKQNDTAPNLQVMLLQGDGTPQDLTAATVTFSLRRLDPPPVVMTITDGACSIVGPAPNGTVLYAWLPGNTSVVGFYLGEFHVLLPDGRTITFPTGGGLTVYVVASLP